jgi:hypothetical protein
MQRVLRRQDESLNVKLGYTETRITGPPGPKECVMRWLSLFRSMPLPVVGLTLIFLTVPFASLCFMATPWDIAAASGRTAAATFVCAYWILPLAIGYSLLRKHHWFLPLYVAQCIFLTAHTLLAQPQAAQITVARIILIGLMVYVGTLMGNRNFLYPLLTTQFRSWRRSVRFRVGRAVLLSHKSANAAIPAVLFDCSTTGVQLSIHTRDLGIEGLKFEKGMRLDLRIPMDERLVEMRIPLEVAWSGESEGRVRVGCRALDAMAMKSYVATEVNKQEATVRLPIPKGYAFDQDIQETALILWLACIVLCFALPAFF